MSGFVAAPPEPTPDAVVDGDGWWPSLSIAAFTSAMRMPRDVTDGRIREALLAGLIETARELSSWKACQVAAGITSLEGIEAPEFGGEKQPVILWRRAVYAFAAADLADTHNDISATGEGRARTELGATSSGEHRRNATQAIRAIKGRSRNRVALK